MGLNCDNDTVMLILETSDLITNSNCSVKLMKVDNRKLVAYFRCFEDFTCYEASPASCCGQSYFNNL